MTPAINLAKDAQIRFTTHRYQSDPSAPSYGLEAADKLNIQPDSVFKTLVTECDGQLIVAIIPVTHSLSLKHVAKAVNAKKATMANPELVAKKTGYVMGGVSPLGQKTSLVTLLDTRAQTLNTIYISAGKRGLEIALAPKDLQNLTQATLVDLCV